jgi:hypothetical protein
MKAISFNGKPISCLQSDAQFEDQTGEDKHRDLFEGLDRE